MAYLRARACSGAELQPQPPLGRAGVVPFQRLKLPVRLRCGWLYPRSCPAGFAAPIRFVAAYWPSHLPPLGPPQLIGGAVTRHGAPFRQPLQLAERPCTANLSPACKI